MDAGSPSDEELVSAARGAPRDDLAAFEALVQRHQAKVVANCRYLAGAEDADDLAQEVFVKAFFGNRKFEGRSAFKTWLWRVKANHCISFVRRRKGPRTVSLDDLVETEQPEETQVLPVAERALEAREDRALIGRVLDSLPDNLRMPLILRDLDGLAYQDIADVMGLKLSAVKMRIKRARETFRQRFAEAQDPVVSASDPPSAEFLSTRK